VLKAPLNKTNQAEGNYWKMETLSSIKISYFVSLDEKLTFPHTSWTPSTASAAGGRGQGGNLSSPMQ
jgi:hypothetical protein